MIAATLLASAALAAAPFPETFPVPPGSQPEGIASGQGTTLYVGSRADGSVYRADARTGDGEVLVEGADDREAYGLKYANGELYVAGGPTGFGYVYDARTGEDVAQYDFDGGFVNDVTVTREAAYFTDSQKPLLYVVPRDGGAPSTLQLGGDWEQVAGFNANGIAATPDGETLIVVNSTTGGLFAVDADTGDAQRIDAPLVPRGDGILLRGKLLYVVQNRDNQIAVIRLDPDLTSGTLVATLTDPDFKVPTTVAALGRRLYAINARFDLPVHTPDTTYNVVKVG
jgi:DNA-binding beta-propeller fold protein YncE